MIAPASRATTIDALLRLLERGIVSSDDAREMFALYQAATGTRGVVLSQGHGFHHWNQHEGIDPRWPALIETRGGVFKVNSAEPVRWAEGSSGGGGARRLGDLSGPREARRFSTIYRT